MNNSETILVRRSEVQDAIDRVARLSAEKANAITAAESWAAQYQTACRRAEKAERHSIVLRAAVMAAIPCLDTDRDLTDADVQGTYPELIRRRSALRHCQAAIGLICEQPMTAEPLITCGKCGQPMRYNVPRIGPDGGYVHAATGSMECALTDTDLRATFDAMEDEQADDYADYLRRCGGVPISTIKPS